MQEQFDVHTPRLDSRLFRICMLVARLGLAYLFFTQLWWKLPPRFGCGAEFAFPVPAEQNHYDSNGSSGLCFWMGLRVESTPRSRARCWWPICARRVCPLSAPTSLPSPG